MPKRIPTFRPAGSTPYHELWDRKVSNGFYWSPEWRKLRAYHLSIEPLCRMCMAEGRYVAASIADHLVPISVDPNRRLDADNLRSLCYAHHNSRHKRKPGI